MIDQECVPVGSATEEREDADAIRDLVGVAMRTYQSPLLRYATQILRQQPEDAHDVVQEAFLRYYQALLAGQTIDTPNKWLHRVTHNLAIDLYRRSARQSPLLNDGSELADTAPTADESASRHEQCQLAVAELHRLPEEQRQVVLLKVLRGLTLEDISEITGLKVGTVYYRLNQGLRTLAARMNKQGAES